MPRSVIVAPQPEAVEAGRDVLSAGGNACDAAVVAALVQCVVDPLNTSIGGSGCALVYDRPAGKVHELSFMSRAGSRVRPDMWSNRSVPVDIGYAGACVPGNPRGLAELLKRYGTITWSDALRPAVRLARSGFRINRLLVREWHEDVRGEPDPYARLVTPEARRVLLRNGAIPNRLGDLLRHPDLAATLEALQIMGPDAVYRGDIARTMAADNESNGGWLTVDDFVSYEAEWRRPVEGAYGPHTYFGPTPPASGATILHILRLLSADDLRAIGHNSLAYLHLLAEVFLWPCTRC